MHFRQCLFWMLKEILWVDKKEQFSITMGDMLEDVIRDREEIQDQIRSLKELKEILGDE